MSAESGVGTSASAESVAGRGGQDAWAVVSSRVRGSSGVPGSRETPPNTYPARRGDRGGRSASDPPGHRRPASKEGPEEPRPARPSAESVGALGPSGGFGRR